MDAPHKTVKAHMEVDVLLGWSSSLNAVKMTKWHLYSFSRERAKSVIFFL